MMSTIFYSFFNQLYWIRAEIIKIAKRYAEKVKNAMPVKMIVLYGSQVSGKTHKDSDIDIAVIVDEFQGDYLAASAELFNLVRGISTRIEPVLLSRKHDRSGFVAGVLRQGKVIYKKKHTKNGISTFALAKFIP